MLKSGPGWLGDFGWEGGRLVLRQTDVRLIPDKHVVAELGHWIAYLLLLSCVAVLARLRPRRRLAILFTPQPARPWYLARGAALWAGVRSARREADADIAFYFEDSTAGSPPPSRVPVLNGRCKNISKSHAARVFERVFGRPLSVDPRVFDGEMVEKSEKNGVHDGRVVVGSRLPRPGYVYQRCVDTSDARGVCRDLRTVCVGGRPIVVWEKEKAAGSRFSINNRRAVLREPGEVFSAVELDGIRRFCLAMGLDWGGLDILRDRARWPDLHRRRQQDRSRSGGRPLRARQDPVHAQAGRGPSGSHRDPAGAGNRGSCPRRLRGRRSLNGDGSTYDGDLMINLPTRTAMLVALVMAAATTVAAAPSPGAPDLSPAFGNTIVSTHPDGRKAKLYLNADHTYSAESRAGSRSGGTWKTKGAKLCLSQKQPHPGLFSYCKTVPAFTVGRPWSDTAVTGERVTNEVVKGRV